MSLVSLLNIARSAMFVHRRSMDLTANNVANAQTPGYSRQRLRMAAHPGGMGYGVADLGIERQRDGLLDHAYRTESGRFGRSGTLMNLLAPLESVLGEPGVSDIAASLDDLFNAFASLANDPSSPVQRELVRVAGGGFVRRMQEVAGSLTPAATSSVDRLRTEVKEINSIADRLADLNRQIVAAGGAAPELEDERDLLVDQLSMFMTVRVVGRADGSIGVIAGETTLVDGARRQQLAVASLGAGAYGVRVVGGAVVDPLGGSLAAIVEFTSKALPELRRMLDDLARAVVTDVNAVHSAGYDRQGIAGRNFFNPAAVTALTISLSDEVLSSSDAIAAGATAAGGDGAVALELARLARSGSMGLGGLTFREGYARFATSIAVRSADATTQTELAATLVDRADAHRLSVSGVSIDEEMILLIDQQEAYQAAARLVQVAQEMMDDVLNML